jgi:hypothetical protein
MTTYAVHVKQRLRACASQVLSSGFHLQCYISVQVDLLANVHIRYTDKSGNWDRIQSIQIRTRIENETVYFVLFTGERMPPIPGRWRNTIVRLHKIN